MGAIKLQFWVIPGLHRSHVPESLVLKPVDVLVKTITEDQGVTIEQVRKKTRKTEVVRTRHLLFYFFKYYTPMTLKEIGAFIKPHDPYDHSTVIHGVSTIIELSETDFDFREKLRLLRLKVSGSISECTVKDSPSKTPKP